MRLKEILVSKHKTDFPSLSAVIGGYLGGHLKCVWGGVRKMSRGCLGVSWDSCGGCVEECMEDVIILSYQSCQSCAVTLLTESKKEVDIRHQYLCQNPNAPEPTTGSDILGVLVFISARTTYYFNLMNIYHNDYKQFYTKKYLNFL